MYGLNTQPVSYFSSRMDISTVLGIFLESKKYLRNQNKSLYTITSTAMFQFTLNYCSMLHTCVNITHITNSITSLRSVSRRAVGTPCKTMYILVQSQVTLYHFLDTETFAWTVQHITDKKSDCHSFAYLLKSLPCHSNHHHAKATRLHPLSYLTQTTLTVPF